MGSSKSPGVSDLNQFDITRRQLHRALNAVTVINTHPAKLTLTDLQALLSIMLANNTAIAGDTLMCEADIWRRVFGGADIMDVQSFNKLTLKLSTFQYRLNSGKKVDGAGLVDKRRTSDDNRSAIEPVLTKRGQVVVHDFLTALQKSHVPAHQRIARR